MISAKMAIDTVEALEQAIRVTSRAWLEQRRRECAPGGHV
jgi:hypothetical protein